MQPRENVKKRFDGIRHALSWQHSALVIFALTLLASCASDPKVRVVTETRTVTEQVEVYRPLPAELTDPLPYPPSLSEGFTVDDVLDTAFALYDLLDAANADRERAGKLTRPESEPDAPP